MRKFLILFLFVFGCSHANHNNDNIIDFANKDLNCIWETLDNYDFEEYKNRSVIFIKKHNYNELFSLTFLFWQSERVFPMFPNNFEFKVMSFLFENMPMNYNHTEALKYSYYQFGFIFIHQVINGDIKMPNNNDISYNELFHYLSLNLTERQFDTLYPKLTLTNEEIYSILLKSGNLPVAWRYYSLYCDKDCVSLNYQVQRTIWREYVKNINMDENWKLLNNGGIFHRSLKDPGDGLYYAVDGYNSSLVKYLLKYNNYENLLNSEINRLLIVAMDSGNFEVFKNILIKFRNRDLACDYLYEEAMKQVKKDYMVFIKANCNGSGSADKNN